MSSSFNIISEQAGDITILHLEGRLDPLSAGTLESQARQLHQAGSVCFLLDFKNVTAVTSAGLRAILGIYKMLNPKEDAPSAKHSQPDEPFRTPYLKLANLSPEVYYVFNVAGFLHNIAIYSDLETALSSFT